MDASRPRKEDPNDARLTYPGHGRPETIILYSRYSLYIYLEATYYIIFIPFQQLAYNGFALTTPLNRTPEPVPHGGTLLPVKGCGCPAPTPAQIHPATQGTACYLFFPSRAAA
jgi:hypothetical protein